VDMDDPERKPLLVSEFEERVVQTDEMESEPDTAFLGLFGEIGSLVSALKKRRRDKDAYFGYERAVLEKSVTCSGMRQPLLAGAARH